MTYFTGAFINKNSSLTFNVKSECTNKYIEKSAFMKSTLDWCVLICREKANRRMKRTFIFLLFIKNRILPIEAQHGKKPEMKRKRCLTVKQCRAMLYEICVNGNFTLRFHFISSFFLFLVFISESLYRCLYFFHTSS